MKKRIVVTGIGIVSANGFGKGEFWKNTADGKSAASPLKGFDTTKFNKHVAVELDRERLKSLAKTEGEDMILQMARCAIGEALLDAEVEDVTDHADRIGMVLGTSLGGMTNGLKFHEAYLQGKPYQPEWIAGVPTEKVVDAMMDEFGIGGPSCTVVTACTSSANAIGYAFDLLKNGKADMMITGGVDPVSKISFAGFNALRSMDGEICRPFDLNRKGILLGEGAGILILETLESAQRRKAKIYAEVCSYGLANDAYHITSPHPNGIGAIKSMQDALSMAGVDPSQVDYINAHGTGTMLNDKVETLAIKQVFGEHAKELAISSTKSMIGHTLGAAGSIELIVTILAMEHGFVPPTANYETFDPNCDLNYVPNTGIAKEIHYALSNSFAFAGHCCSILVQKWGETNG